MHDRIAHALMHGLMHLGHALVTKYGSHGHSRSAVRCRSCGSSDVKVVFDCCSSNLCVRCASTMLEHIYGNRYMKRCRFCNATKFVNLG